MTSLHITAHRRASGELPLETVRAIAVISLVSFHVIGGGHGGGLDLPYPHPLRYYADLMVDVRMPLFAFIAGAVYALKPVSRDQLMPFMVGKMRRLALPGITAITVFLIFATAMGARDALQGPIWEPYISNYAIFWFLQAILLIFVFYGTADILTQGKVLFPTMVVAALAVAFDWQIPTEIMSANTVTSLLFYFLLGIAFMRHREAILSQRKVVLSLAVALLVLGFTLNLAILRETGALSSNRLDFQSLAFGSGLCVAALLTLPVIGWLRWLGAFSLTIYLYHILATSGARRGLSAVGIESPWVQVLVGTALGVLLPVLLHLVALRMAPTRLLVLGLRAAPRKEAAGSSTRRQVRAGKEKPERVFRTSS